MCEPTSRQLEDFFENIVTYLPDCDVLKENYQSWIKLDERIQFLAMSLLDRGLIQPEEVDVGTHVHMIYNRLSLVEIRAFDTWSSMQSEYGAIGNSLGYSNTFTYSLDCEVIKISAYITLAIHEAWNTYQMHRSAEENPFDFSIKHQKSEDQVSSASDSDQEEDILIENEPNNTSTKTEEDSSRLELDQSLLSSFYSEPEHDLYQYQILSPELSPIQPEESLHNLTVRGRRLKNPYLQEDTYHFGSGSSKTNYDAINLLLDKSTEEASSSSSTSSESSSDDWQEIPDDAADGEAEAEDNLKNEIFFDAITGEEEDKPSEADVEVNNNSTNDIRKAKSV